MSATNSQIPVVKIDNTSDAFATILIVEFPDVKSRDREIIGLVSLPPLSPSLWAAGTRVAP